MTTIHGLNNDRLGDLLERLYFKLTSDLLMRNAGPDPLRLQNMIDRIVDRMIPPLRA
jgi:hypothetical protein